MHPGRDRGRRALVGGKRLQVAGVVGAHPPMVPPSRPARPPSPAGRPSVRRPSCRSTTWSARSMRAASWVETTLAMPRAWVSSTSRSMIVAAVSESSWPVGSSATRMSGAPTSARAIPTRCCCPPESS
ncbi:hypothetical protein [Ornithinimicrobium kibberense]|uniref:hypothetical protein n=1 Tax=Ornithinimicrobium kibberense TaxID=282060 RepID=UPI00361CBBE5